MLSRNISEIFQKSLFAERLKIPLTALYVYLLILMKQEHLIITISDYAKEVIYRCHLKKNTSRILTRKYLR